MKLDMPLNAEIKTEIQGQNARQFFLYKMKLNLNLITEKKITEQLSEKT